MRKFLITSLIFMISIMPILGQSSEVKQEIAESKSAQTGFSSLIDSFDIFIPKEKYSAREWDASRLYLNADNESLQGDFSLRLDYVLSPYDTSGSMVAAEWDIYPSFDFSKATTGSIWVKGDGSDNIFGIGFMDSDGEIWVVKSRRVLSSSAWKEFKFGLKDFSLSSIGDIGNRKFDTTGIKAILYIIESRDGIERQGSIKIDNFTFGNANFPAEVIERRPYSLIQSGYVDVEYRKINSYLPDYAAEFKKGDLFWNLLYLNIVYKSDLILGVGVLRLGGLDFGLANERYGIANSFQSDFTVMLYLNRITKQVHFVKIGRVGPYFNDYIMSEDYEIGEGVDNRSRTGHFLMGAQAQGKALSLVNYNLVYIKQWHNGFITGGKAWFNYENFRFSGAAVDYEAKAMEKRDESVFQSKQALQDLSWTGKIDIFLDELFDSGSAKLSGIYGENIYKRFAKIYEMPYNEYEDVNAADEITDDNYFREAMDFSDLTFMKDRDLNPLYEGLASSKKYTGTMYRGEIILNDLFYPLSFIKGEYEKISPHFMPMFRNKEVMREHPNILYFNHREMYGVSLSATIWKFGISGLYKNMASTLNASDTNYYKNGLNFGGTLKYRIYGQTMIGVNDEILKLDFPNQTENSYNENKFRFFLNFMMIRNLSLKGEYTYVKIEHTGDTSSSKEKITQYSISAKYNVTRDAFIQADYTQLLPIDTSYVDYGGRGPNMYEPKDLFKVLLHIDFRL